MERTVWTDERLTDAADRLRAEVRDTRVELRQDIRELRQFMFYGFLALTATQLGIIASIVATA